MIEAASSAPGPPPGDRGRAGGSAFDTGTAVALDARDHALMAELGATPEALLAAQDPSPLPERIGRFAIEGPLGEGGYGIVYRGRDPELGRVVAIKVLKPVARFSPEARKRFLNEARAAARLDHAHIVPVHETGQDGPLSYIAYAYCPGPTLSAWVAAQGGAVPPRTAAEIVVKLAEAVQHAHDCGILHRDLKPDNILMAPEPKITDFGLARLRDPGDADATQTGSVVGTPKYMAPEQATERSKDIGPATDIYALGAILYTILLGRPPFLGDSRQEVIAQLINNEPVRPRLLRPTLPRDLETICLKCLEKPPSRRYARAGDLAADLQCYLERRPIRARPVSLFEHTWRWCRRSPAPAALGFVVCLSVVGLAGLWRRSEYQRKRAEAGLAQAEERRREIAKTLNDVLGLAVDVYEKAGPDAAGLLIPGVENARAWLKASVEEEPSNTAHLKLLANIDYRLSTIYGSTFKIPRNYFYALQLLNESIELWERLLSLAPGDRAAQIGEAYSLLLAADTKLNIFKNNNEFERLVRGAMRIEQQMGAEAKPRPLSIRFAESFGHQAFFWATRQEWDRARIAVETGLSFARAATTSGERAVQPSEQELEQLTKLAALTRASWITGGGPDDGPPEAEPQIDRFIAAMAEQVASLGLDDSHIPRACLWIWHVGAEIATERRRNDDLEGAQQIDHRLYALGERLTRDFSKRSHSHVLLSEACIQKAKNSYRAKDVAAVARWKQEALRAIERAAALAPDDDSIRLLVTDRQRRVATPTTFP